MTKLVAEFRMLVDLFCFMMADYSPQQAARKKLVVIEGLPAEYHNN